MWLAVAACGWHGILVSTVFHCSNIRQLELRSLVLAMVLGDLYVFVRILTADENI